MENPVLHSTHQIEQSPMHPVDSKHPIPLVDLTLVVVTSTDTNVFPLGATLPLICGEHVKGKDGVIYSITPDPLEGFFFHRGRDNGTGTYVFRILN